MFKRLKPILKIAVLIFASSFCSVSAQTQAASVVRLSDHVAKKQLLAAQHIGRLAPTRNITLAIALKSPNPAGLEMLVRRIYTPGDFQYKKFLTPDEFTKSFSPSTADYAALTDFLKSKGLRVKTQANRLLVSVDGPVSAVEAAFQIEMHSFQSASGRVFFSTTNNPSLPSNVANKIHGIFGLNNLVRPTRNLHMAAGSVDRATANGIGSGPAGTLTPADVIQAYGLNGVAQKGDGQTLALVEFDGFTQSDIDTYIRQFAISRSPTLEVVRIGSASGVPAAPKDANSGAIEVTLDIELMIGMAPNAQKIVVYEAPPLDQTSSDSSFRSYESGMLPMLHQIANENRAQQISISWGAPELGVQRTVLDAENTIYMQMAAQGQSVLAATGDTAAYSDTSSLSVMDPASQPYVLAVGGTKLNSGSPGVYGSESSWSDASKQSNGVYSAGAGGGGGISAVWPTPSWQFGLSSSLNMGSSSNRMIPDVSLNADPGSGYGIIFAGGVYHVGGTSCAAPIWAAFTALVNQQRVAAGYGLIGYLNPSIYRIAQSSLYSQSFHDVADGSTNLYYPAKPGYDLSTGWGSFQGVGLFRALTNRILPPSTPNNLKLVEITQ